MPLAQGSSHTISFANLRTASGERNPLPAGMFPTATLVPATAGVLGPQSQADGSVPLTVANDYVGPIEVDGTFVYADGTVIAFAPYVDTVVAPDDTLGDVLLDGNASPAVAVVPATPNPAAPVADSSAPAADPAPVAADPAAADPAAAPVADPAAPAAA